MVHSSGYCRVSAVAESDSKLTPASINLAEFCQFPTLLCVMSQTLASIQALNNNVEHWLQSTMTDLNNAISDIGNVLQTRPALPVWGYRLGPAAVHRLRCIASYKCSLLTSRWPEQRCWLLEVPKFRDSFQEFLLPLSGVENGSQHFRVPLTSLITDVALEISAH